MISHSHVRSRKTHPQRTAEGILQGHPRPRPARRHHLSDRADRGAALRENHHRWRTRDLHLEVPVCGHRVPHREKRNAARVRRRARHAPPASRVEIQRIRQRPPGGKHLQRTNLLLLRRRHRRSHRRHRAAHRRLDHPRAVLRRQRRDLSGGIRQTKPVHPRRPPGDPQSRRHSLDRLRALRFLGVRARRAGHHVHALGPHRC